MRRRGIIVAVIAAAALGGCSIGARDIDYSRDRAISQDIDASHQTSSPLLKHGQIQHDEPRGSLPWELDARHQPPQ